MDTGSPFAVEEASGPRELERIEGRQAAMIERAFDGARRLVAGV
jgi:hypothetical protein